MVDVQNDPSDSLAFKFHGWKAMHGATSSWKIITPFRERSQTFRNMTCDISNTLLSILTKKMEMKRLSA